MTTATCAKCDGSGIFIRSERVLRDDEHSNLLKFGGDSKRIELCECIRAELAALKAARAADAPATGVLGLFESIGDLVNEVAAPKKGGG